MPEAELQAKVLSLSNELLSTNTELQAVQEQLRSALRDSVLAKRQLGEQVAVNETLRAELSAQAQQVVTMENELADLSSSLVDEANQQVSEANRRTATAQRLVLERDDVIAAQSAELLALKGMLERITEPSSTLSNEGTPPPLGPASAASSPRPSAVQSRRRVGPDPTGEVTQSLILDLDAYASPMRPLMRTDLPDFQDFCDLWGCQFNLPKPTLFHLPTDPWRKSVLVNRIIREDIEPTLRTDKSPYLSYLNMRQYVTSVMDLTIALEPVHSKDKAFSRRPSLPCVLCGEQRGGDKYERVYRARLTPDGDKLILDLGCVAKTRLACELAGLLRSIAKRPPANRSHQILAWRQLNSMREQLFWARTGGLFPDSDDLLAAVQHVAADDFAFDPQDEPRSVMTAALNPADGVPASDAADAKEAGTNAAGSRDAVSPRMPAVLNSDLRNTETQTPEVKNLPSTDSAMDLSTKSTKETITKSSPSKPHTATHRVVTQSTTQSTTESALPLNTSAPLKSTSTGAGLEFEEIHGSSASTCDSATSASPAPAEVVQPVVSPEMKQPRAELSHPFVHLNASVESDLDVFQEASENVSTK